MPEPIAIGPRDTDFTVRLYDRRSADGAVRRALHFGGDVMLGRRYQNSDRVETPLVRNDSSARRVGSSLASMSSVADATIVNLETVVGVLPAERAYPGKRFLLQSPPATLALLEALGVDLVTLGNNHAADWKDAGVTSTLDALDDAEMPHVGAGLTTADAVAPLVIDVDGLSVGVVSLTTVDGDFVNDQLPRSVAEIPVDLPVAEAWQYEMRTVGFGAPGSAGAVSAAPRRAGDMWDEFERLEPVLGERQVADLWATITAPEAYPELQDWTARRGHGGAGGYSRAALTDSIASARRMGAEFVVVQFHGGYQFAEVKSSFVRRISHLAIDSGADAVISHHPHVLQGAEWYNGRLIMYSLGNLVFDQDFLSTFPSAILRLVVEGEELIEARLLPVMIDAYRPVPVVGDVAERITRMILERSLTPAESDRIVGLEVGGVLLDEAADGVEPVGVSFERNTGVVGRSHPVLTTDVVVGPRSPATLPPCFVMRADLLDDGVEYGIDLFDWGGFDDFTADGDRGRPMHWITPADPDRWAMVQGSSDDPFDDALELISDSNKPVTARFAARINVSRHKIYDTDEGRPADAPPSYSITFDAKRERGESPSLRFVVYNVDDSDPTSDPESLELRDVEIPFDLPDDSEWHSITLEAATRAPDSGEWRRGGSRHDVRPDTCILSRQIHRRQRSGVRMASRSADPDRDVDRGRRLSRRRGRKHRCDPVRLLTSLVCRVPLHLIGRVRTTASGEGAEGATTPESLRQPDRSGRQRWKAVDMIGSPMGKARIG